jgi:hypothetical protein
MDDSGAPKKNIRLILEQMPTILTFIPCSNRGKSPTDERIISHVRVIVYNSISCATVPGGLADGDGENFSSLEDVLGLV